MPTTTSSPKRNKLFAIVGVALLLVSIITGAMAIINVKDFSADGGVDIKADKGYYLLADAEVLQAQQCEFQDGEQNPVSDKISDLQILVEDNDGNLEIKDVALPLTESKGVFAKITFSEDLTGVSQKCDQGKSYISTFSGTVLNVLRWLTLLTLVAGLAFLIAFAVIRPRPAQSTGHNGETENDDQHGVEQNNNAYMGEAEDARDEGETK